MHILRSPLRSSVARLNRSARPGAAGSAVEAKFIRLIRNSVAVLGLVASIASAVVIRHDIPDAAYLRNEADFPAVFALHRDPSGRSNCVATLIGKRWALTAGHCVPAGWRPKVGDPGLPVEIAGKSTFIDRAIHHPDATMPRPFTSNFTDLVLLHLARPITHVAPVELYRAKDEEGLVVYLPGWGGSGNGKDGLKRESDGLFRVAANRIDAAGERYVEFKFDDPRTNRGALTLEGISGPGDSGGPALVRTPRGWATLGVSSHQQTFGGPQGKYGVLERYTRVSQVIPWITSQTSNVTR